MIRRLLVAVLLAPALGGCASEEAKTVEGAFDTPVTFAQVTIALTSTSAKGVTTRTTLAGPYKYYGEIYAVPPDEVAQLREGRRTELGGLLARVEGWVDEAESQADAEFGGEPVTRVSGTLDAAAAVRDLQALAKPQLLYDLDLGAGFPLPEPTARADVALRDLVHTEQLELTRAVQRFGQRLDAVEAGKDPSVLVTATPRLADAAHAHADAVRTVQAATPEYRRARDLLIYALDANEGALRSLASTAETAIDPEEIQDAVATVARNSERLAAMRDVFYPGDPGPVIEA